MALPTTSLSVHLLGWSFISLYLLIRSRVKGEQIQIVFFKLLQGYYTLTVYFTTHFRGWSSGNQLAKHKTIITLNLWLWKKSRENEKIFSWQSLCLYSWQESLPSRLHHWNLHTTSQDIQTKCLLSYKRLLQPHSFRKIKEDLSWCQSKLCCHKQM